MEYQPTFSSLRINRSLGSTPDLPFCSIISQNKVLYLSGSNVILEHLQTHQQQILWTNTSGKIVLMEHFTNSFGDHYLGLAIRDQDAMAYKIKIMKLSFRGIENKDQKELDVMHFMKFVSPLDNIIQLKLIAGGHIFCLVTQYNNVQTFNMFKSIDCSRIWVKLFRCPMLFNQFIISKTHYIGIITHPAKSKPILSVIILGELDRKKEFTITELEEDQQIIDLKFESKNSDAIMFALSNEGFLYFYWISQPQLRFIRKIDLKVEITDEKVGWMIKMPVKLEIAGNKIIVMYEQGIQVGVLTFSLHDLSERVKLQMIPVDVFPDGGINLKNVSCFRIAKDNCHLSLALEINNAHSEQKNDCTPFTSYKNLPLSKVLIEPQHKYYHICQINLTTALVPSSDPTFCYSGALTSNTCNNEVIMSHYCNHNNTIMILLKNNMLKYYKLAYQDKEERFILWSYSMQGESLFVRCHPFNYSLMVSYGDVVKFHFYNYEKIFDSFLSININCKHAQYSPFGNQLALATPTHLLVLNPYTYQITHKIVIPSLTLAENVSLDRTISNLYYDDNCHLLIKNSHHLWIHREGKLSNFGNLQGLGNGDGIIALDIKRQIVLSAFDRKMFVLGKYKSSQKCQIKAKIDVEATALCLCHEIGVLLLGTKAGVLMMVKYPEHLASNSFHHNSFKLPLFSDSIKSISVSPSFQHVYTISQKGQISICQLIANGSRLTRQIKVKLFKCNDTDLPLTGKWIISEKSMERIGGEMVKLRGEEAEIMKENQQYCSS